MAWGARRAIRLYEVLHVQRVGSFLPRFFAGSFIVNAAMSLGRALWFFRGFDATAADAVEGMEIGLIGLIG